MQLLGKHDSFVLFLFCFTNGTFWITFFFMCFAYFANAVRFLFLWLFGDFFVFFVIEVMYSLQVVSG